MNLGDNNGRAGLAGFLRKRFPALRSRDFALLWSGQAISVVGSQMQITTVRWHIYALTNSYVALGLIGLSRLIPVILFSLLGGAVADAWDRRRVMLVTQTLLALSAAALAYMTATHRITAVAIYVVMVLGAAAVAFDNPARQSMIPALVPREHFPNAASLNSIAMQVAAIVGPAMAGILIAKRTMAVTYWVNAVSFLAVIAALLVMHSVPVDGRSVDRSAFTGKALLEGLRFVWSTPILVSTIVLDFLATFFSSATSLLPVYASDILRVGPRGYGILSSAEAVGSVVAGTIMALRPAIKRQGVVMLWAVAVYGCATVVFGASHWFIVTLMALMAVGAADTVSTILRQTIRQLVTPDRLRGRMTAVGMIFLMDGPQLGNLEAGVAAKWFGAIWSVVSGGLACVAVTGWIAAKSKDLRNYRMDVSGAAEEQTIQDKLEAD